MITLNDLYLNFAGGRKMVKRFMAVGLVLLAVAALLTACGAPGTQGPLGEPGLPGNPGQPGLQGPPAELPTATIVVIPAQGKPGEAMTVLGAGFKPGEIVIVEIVIGEIPTALGYREKVDGEMKRQHVVDDNGVFRIISAIPRKGVSVPGVHPVVATGDKGSEAVVPIEITE